MTDWRLLEGSMLAVQVRDGAHNALTRLQHAEELRDLKLLAAVSPDVDLQDQTSLLWGIFTRFDPARDVQFPRMEMIGAAPVYGGTMGIDATWKPGYPEPLEMTPEIKERVDRRWEEYWR